MFHMNISKYNIRIADIDLYNICVIPHTEIFGCNNLVSYKVENTMDV